MEYRENRAIYLQIADMVCENILKREWKEKERIPSIREFAVAVEVNPNTVLRAYNYLQSEGVIHNKRGIGYFIEEGARKRVLELKREEFIRNELPYFFKTLDMLSIDFNQLEELYKKYRGEIDENK